MMIQESLSLIGLIPRSDGLSLMVERAGLTGAVGMAGEGVMWGIAGNSGWVCAEATKGFEGGVSEESNKVGCIELATDDAKEIASRVCSPSWEMCMALAVAPISRVVA